MTLHHAPIDPATASASTPRRGTNRIFSPTVTTSDAAAVNTGVRVSFRAKKLGVSTLIST